MIDLTRHLAYGEGKKRMEELPMSIPGIGGGDQGGASGAGSAGGASPLDALKKLDPIKMKLEKDKGGSDSKQVGNAAAAGPG
jgi:hypothetical protein